MAVEVAQANVISNGMKDQINCVVAAGFGAPELQENGPYDLIFANILKGPLIGLAPDIAQNTALHGNVILSGILNEQADEVLSVYEENGFNLEKRGVIVDWTTLTLSKKGQN